MFYKTNSTFDLSPLASHLLYACKTGHGGDPTTSDLHPEIQVVLLGEGRLSLVECHPGVDNPRESTERTMAKKVAVIGAGVSGLSSIKCCLDENLEPTCFERSSDFGGLWKFATTVRSVTKRPDFSETGQWEVVTETEGKQDRAVFDAVMVCTGQFLSPRLPLESFPGIHKFKGQILHSQEYRIPDAFRGKRILVVGLGNTGGDVAVELSGIAAQVFLSTRTGAWVRSRSSVGGYPLNMMQTRWRNFLARVLPSRFVSWNQERQMNKIFNHENYGLSIAKGKKPKFIVNDELPTCT